MTTPIQFGYDPAANADMTAAAVKLAPGGHSQSLPDDKSIRRDEHRHTPTYGFLQEIAYEFVRGRYHATAQYGMTVDRNQMLGQTARYIQGQSDVSDITAQTIASQAIGEYESRRVPVTFDIDRSTSHTVFLRDGRTGRMHAVTALELSHLLANHTGQLT